MFQMPPQPFFKQPRTPSIEMKSKPSRRESSFKDRMQHRAHSVHDLHLAHRGSYSIERLQAFDEYCNRTSMKRVFGICLFLPLPALTVAIGMECIPLQHPRDGWRANYGAFIRDSLMFFMTCFGLCVQTRQLVPNLSMSMFRMLLVSAATSLCSISLRMLIAEMWVYPIPFGYAWGATPYSMFVATFFLIAVGRKQFRDKPGLFRELCQQFVIVMVQVMLCVVYPTYNAIYLRLNKWQQPLFVFVLPLLKFVMQNIVAWSTSHLVEFMPGVTVFSVEVFNALYLAKCMQSAGSIATFAAIMVFDTFESVVAYRDMKAQTANLYQLMKQYNATNPDKRFVDTVMAVCQEPEVLSRKWSNIRVRSPIRLTLSIESTVMIDELFRTQTAALARVSIIDKEAATKAAGPENKSISQPKPRPAVELSPVIAYVDRDSASPYPPSEDVVFVSRGATTARFQEAKASKLGGDLSDMNISSEDISAIESQVDDFGTNQDGSKQQTELLLFRPNVERVGPSSNEAIRSRLLQRTITYDSLRLTKEELLRLASNTKLNDSKFAPKIASNSPALTSDEKVQFVNQSLKIIFHCEYHALVEYIEAMIPMLYCVYVTILTQLPSHVYYPETRNMTDKHVEKMVSNIFTYAWLEVLSFIAMHYTIKWKFGFSPAYLLAFVLENQAMEFQARLLVWFTYVLEITLVHYGVDLTLKFAWLKGDWSGM